MISMLKKITRFLIGSILAFGAFLFVALIAVQIVLMAGINIIATGKGSAFIAAKINDAIENSGYQIAFDALYYDPVRGFTVYDLSVSDTQGEFLTLDRFSLAASFVLSPLRALDLHAQGGTLSLVRLPISKEPEEISESTSIQPFATPDIYFRTITLSRLSFERINLGEDIVKNGYEFSPYLQAKLSLEDSIALTLKLKPGIPPIAPGLAAPEQLDIEASIIPSTLDFALPAFSLAAKDYALSVQGTGNLKEDGIISLSANLNHDDLTILTQNALQKFSAQMNIQGPISGPALDLSALLTTASLKERGLDDITIAVKTSDISQGMQGDVKIETAFKKEPVLLENKIAYDAPALRITGLKGSAPELSVQGEGVLSTETNLFDGTLRVNASDLSYYKDLAGLALSGKAEATAKLSASEEKTQAADITLNLSNAAYDTIKVKSLSAQALIPSIATPWPQSGTVNTSSMQITSDLTIDSFDAAIKQEDSQNYKLTLKGSGHAPAALSFDGSAKLSDLTQAIPVIRDIALNVRSGASTIKLSGGFSKEILDLTLAAHDFRGADLPVSLPSPLKDIRIDLDAAMKGAPAKPQTDLTAQLRGLGAGAYQNASVTIKAQHDSENVTATITGIGAGIRKLDAAASLPFALSILPFHASFDAASPLSGTIAADIDLAALSPLFLPPTQSLSGALIANGTIGGTINAPAPVLSIKLNNGVFEESGSGIVIADLAAIADITKDNVRLSSLSATDGKQGTMNGSGSLVFANGGADISLRIQSFNAPRSDLVNGIVSADLSLKGTSNALALSGKADIEEMNVLVPETFSSRIPQLNIVEDKKESGPTLLEKLTLDIAIDANNQVFVRGWGLDAEFGGDIAISGAAAAPQFNGMLESKRGRYEEFGKRFSLARANLRFQGDVPPSPYLDIEATTPAGDVTGSILLTGPVQSPSIKFSSTPSLPEDEVLSRILFGKESTRISPFQAVQLAQTIRRFSGQGGGGLDPLGMLRSATGLDDISIDTDESGAASVDVGKYLTDKVYLEVSKGKAENSAEATIQIEVMPSVNIESRIGQDAQGGGGIFWKHDY